MINRSILIKIAKRVRQLRKINNLSQEQLAERAGLHPTFIGNIERAEKNSTITTLERIAQAFKIPLIQLLTFPDDKKISEAKAQDIDLLIEFLAEALERAKSYKKKK
jgi:transcriptional regulator with XRE-family HTH domain